MAQSLGLSFECGVTMIDQSMSSAASGVEQLVAGVSRLVSLPEVCLRISDMIEDGDCSALDLEEVISQDPALAARLLRVVNSALFAPRQRIETISRAVTLMGQRELRDLVLATSAAGAFEHIPIALVNMDQFWRHAVLCGTLAKQIARKSSVLHAERLFVAGLLHDIGKLVIYFRCPDEARAALQCAAANHVPIQDAELRCLGFDHTEVGAELMRVWKLSATHQMSTRWHHAPAGAGPYALDAAIVHLADRLAHAADDGRAEGDLLSEVDVGVWQVLPLHADVCAGLLTEARQQFTQTLAMLRPAARVPRA